MSKGFAAFIRAAGAIIAILNIMSSVLMLKNTYSPDFYDILAFILSAASAVLVLTCSWTFASLIERSLRQGEAQLRQNERLARIEAALGLEPTPAEAQAASEPSPFPDPIKTSTPIPIPDDPDHVICPCCKEKQKRAQHRCKTCGFFFD